MSSLFKSRASRGQWEERKTLRYKTTFCSFLQITESNYISPNIIDKIMRSIYKLINMSFLYIYLMIFFLALPFKPYKATPHFVAVCFRFVQTTVFLLPFSLLCFIINHSQTFYILFLVHNVCIGYENVELVPVIFLFFCYFLRFLENRA